VLYDSGALLAPTAQVNVVHELVFWVGRYATAQRIENEALYLARLPLEMVHQITLRESQIILRPSRFGLETLEAVLVERTAQVTLDGLVERDLLQRGPGVGVRGDKRVRIGIDKTADRQTPHAEHDLRCCLVLAVEYMNGTSALFRFQPGKSHMQLRPPLVELSTSLEMFTPMERGLMWESCARY